MYLNLCKNTHLLAGRRGSLVAHLHHLSHTRGSPCPRMSHNLGNRLVAGVAGVAHPLEPPGADQLREVAGGCGIRNAEQLLHAIIGDAPLSAGFGRDFLQLCPRQQPQHPCFGCRRRDDRRGRWLVRRSSALRNEGGFRRSWFRCG